VPEWREAPPPPFAPFVDAILPQPPGFVGPPPLHPTYDYAQVVDRSRREGMCQGPRGREVVCPFRRQDNRAAVAHFQAIGKNDFWFCQPCLQEGRVVAVLRHTRGARNVNRRDNPATNGTRNLTVCVRHGIEAGHARVTPARFCHDMEACGKCRHITFLTDDNAVLEVNLEYDRRMKIEEAFAAERDILAGLLRDYHDITLGGQIRSADVIRRAEKVVLTRIVTTTTDKVPAEATAALVRSQGASTHRPVDLACAVDHVMGPVANTVRQLEVHAREDFADLSLTRQLADDSNSGPLATWRRLWVAYYHPRAGPSARSWLPSSARIAWAVERSRE